VKISLISVVLLLIAGCGSDTATSTGERACQDLQAKVAACGLNSAGGCNPEHACSAECAAHASCDQLKAGTPSGSYLSCVAACSGAGPGDFVCNDASGYVKQAGVCDGVAQCHDGSDERNCGDAGANRSSGGAGGSSGTTAASGDRDGSVSSGGASSECQAFVAHELSLCPSYSQDGELRSCEVATAEYGPEGCGTAWNDFLNCAAKAPFSTCDEGPTGCDAAMASYFTCQSEFVRKTGCARLDTDSLCTQDRPYLFDCPGAVPNNCAPLSGRGGEVCCSPFAAP
jgi:hypothetical protein